jgi:hypothetical protein
MPNEAHFWSTTRIPGSIKLKSVKVVSSTYLELHNTCYEAYNANPIAFAIIEMTTSLEQRIQYYVVLEGR